MLKDPRKKILAAALIILILSGIGYGAYSIMNRKPITSVEVEQGETSGNGPVIIGEDPEASGGKYIQFDPKE